MYPARDMPWNQRRRHKKEDAGVEPSRDGVEGLQGHVGTTSHEVPEELILIEADNFLSGDHGGAGSNSPNITGTFPGRVCGAYQVLMKQM